MIKNKTNNKHISFMTNCLANHGDCLVSISRAQHKVSHLLLGRVPAGSIVTDPLSKEVIVWIYSNIYNVYILASSVDQLLRLSFLVENVQNVINRHWRTKICYYIETLLHVAASVWRHNRPPRPPAFAAVSGLTCKSGGDCFCPETAPGGEGLHLARWRCVIEDERMDGKSALKILFRGGLGNVTCKGLNGLNNVLDILTHGTRKCCVVYMLSPPLRVVSRCWPCNVVSSLWAQKSVLHERWESHNNRINAKISLKWTF